MRRILIPALVILAGFAGADQPTAKQLVDDATAKAAKESKSVFVHFHASW